MDRLHTCPQCEDEVLFRLPGEATKLYCYNCGWDSGVLGMYLDKEDEEDAIALAIFEFQMSNRFDNENPDPHYGIPRG